MAMGSDSAIRSKARALLSANQSLGLEGCIEV
jgi:hypothetical protein